MDITLYCEGCAVKNSFPSDCDNCPNLRGECHKYHSLLRNYKLFYAVTNNTDPNNKSVLRKIKNE